MTFTCSLSPAIRVVSIVVTVALLGGAVAMGLPGAMGWVGPASPWMLFAAATMPLVLLATWLFVPLGYEVTRDAIVVRRPIGPVRIAASAIESVAPMEASALCLGIRLCASGGLYGVFGLFWSSKMGRFWVWGTRADHLVLIKMRHGLPVILTPDDDEGLTREAVALVG
jgi:Bacterial PH domain